MNKVHFLYRLEVVSSMVKALRQLHWEDCLKTVGFKSND